MVLVAPCPLCLRPVRGVATNVCLSWAVVVVWRRTGGAGARLLVRPLCDDSARTWMVAILGVHHCFSLKAVALDLAPMLSGGVLADS